MAGKTTKISFNVLGTVGIVSDKLEDSKCKPRKTKEFTENVKNLKSYFGTTEHETWMLCAIISYYFENGGEESSFSRLARFFDCNVLTIHAYRKEIESLIKKRYIYNNTSIDGKSIGLKNRFSLSKELLECMTANKKIVITSKENQENTTTLLKKLGKIIEDDDNSYSEKESQTKLMEKEHSSNKFFADIKKLIPEDIQLRMFFYDSCSDFLKGHDSGLLCTLSDVYPDSERFIVGRTFMDDTNKLLKYDLLEFTTKETLDNSDLELTQKAKEMLLGEDAKLFIKQVIKGSDLIMPKDIKQKELFYSKENEAEINRLKTSLQEGNLHVIQKRLAQKGLPKGIVVLLYGAPGTGKTESVYQIAKETGRAIMHVDISSSKSAWFGESEKIIKRIFTDYRQMCKTSIDSKNNRVPILLFNEADGILSKRRDSSSGSIAQTENAMQNIILEEMEKLDGIMICTTNLADNLDAAFERRFLFKINFENPTLDAKKKIWKSKLDWLTEDALDAVTQNYDLSGGQIDNIVRKITMDEILTGRLPDLEELTRMCKSEKLGNKERKIGFF